MLFIKKVTKIDFFILYSIFIIAFISLLQDYSFNLWYEGCHNQLYISLFFFVGRYSRMANNDIFDKAILPFLFTCFIGLLLYIMAPSWYIDYKMQIWDD